LKLTFIDAGVLIAAIRGNADVARRASNLQCPLGHLR
jgi:hypothetical protein